MAILKISHQNNTPTQFPQLLGKNYIVVQGKKQVSQFGGVRVDQYDRPLFLTDLTTNMYPPIPLSNSAGIEISKIQLVGIFIYPSNGNPYQLSGIYDPIYRNLVVDGATTPDDYMLFVSDLFDVDAIHSESLVGTPENYIKINGNFYNNSNAYYKLRFKYYYSDGSDSGLDYSEVTIIAPQNHTYYDPEYTTFPATLTVGKNMIETLNMEKIIEAFQPNIFPINLQATYQSYLNFLNNNFIYPHHIINEFLNKITEYDYKFISKIYILNIDEPSMQSLTEEVPRLTYNNQPVTYGQSIHYLGLENGLLKLNTFGLNEGDTIELLIGLETIQTEFIVMSNDPGDNI